MTNPKHTDTSRSGDLVERLRTSVTVDAIVLAAAQAADRIEALEAENERLRAAISWIEPPFMDDKTPESELRSRIEFCVADAKRAALVEKQ